MPPSIAATNRVYSGALLSPNIKLLAARIENPFIRPHLSGRPQPKEGKVPWIFLYLFHMSGCWSPP